MSPDAGNGPRPGKAAHPGVAPDAGVEPEAPADPPAPPRPGGRLRRLAAAMRSDLRVQARYGIWAATTVTVVGWVLLLRLLPPGARGVAVPAAVFAQLGVVGFSFLGALVLFERAEAALSALVASPLRAGEYLAAKVASLTLLALAATTGVVAAAGVAASPLPLLAGAGLLSAVAVLAAFTSVAPFTALSRWLFPSAPVVLLLGAPLVAYLGVDGAALWVLPTYGPFVLVDGAFSGLPPGRAVAAVVAGGAWTAVAAWLGVRAFQRHVGGRAGGRAGGR